MPQYTVVMSYDASDERDARKQAEGMADANEVLIEAVIHGVPSSFETDNEGQTVMYVERST